MNKVYKVVWSKAKHCYVVASELAKSRTKSPTSSAMNRTVAAGVLACVLSCGAVMPVFAEGANVTYDDANAEVLTLQGPTGTGTKITNVADGELSAGSSDAVTGKQLYSLQQEMLTYDEKLATNNTTIANMQTSLTNVRTKQITMESTLNTVKTQVETGFNVTIDGAKVKAVTPTSNAINFTAGPGVSVAADGENVKIGIDADGVIASGDTGAVTGGIAYTELRPADGNYIAQANTTAANLTALDTRAKANADAIAQEITDRTNAITNISNTVNGLDANSVKYAAEDKAEINLGGTSGTTIKNVKAGELSATSMEAVNGTQLFATNTAIANEVTARENAIGTAVDGNYIEAGKDVYQNMAALDTTVKGLSDNIGTAVSDVLGTVGDGTHYIAKTATVGSNLTTLDTAVYNEATARANAIGTLTNNSYHYISKDANVSENLEELDARTFANSDKIGALNADGHLIKAFGNDSSVAHNLVILDAEADRINSVVTSEIANRTEAIANEATARQDADTALSNRIGEIPDGTTPNYLDPDKSVNENLVSLDTEVKGLSDTLGNLGDNAVQYTDETKAEVNFGGAQGTTLKNVKAGTLSDDSMEAVNGSQLFTTNTNLTNETTARETADTALSNRIGEIPAGTNANYLDSDKSVNENLVSLDTEVKGLADTLGDLDDNAVQYTDETKAEVNFGGTDGTTLKNVKAGTLSATSMEAVNGSQLFTTNTNLANEVTAREQGDTNIMNKIGSIEAGTTTNYLNPDNSVYQNIVALDNKLQETRASLGDLDGNAWSRRSRDRR